MEKRIIGGALLLIGAISGLAWGGLLIAGGNFFGGFDPFGFLSGALMVCGIVFLIFSLIALMGAIMAITGKSWGLAVLGGIFGLLCLGISFTGSLFGLIGLILIAISKDEFGEGPQPGMYPPPAGYPPQQPPPYPPQQQPPMAPPQQQQPMAPPPEQPPMAPAPEEPPMEPPERPPEEPEV